MSKKRIRASNLLLVHRRRIEKGLIHSQFAEPCLYAKAKLVVDTRNHVPRSAAGENLVSA